MITLLSFWNSRTSALSILKRLISILMIYLTKIFQMPSIWQTIMKSLSYIGAVIGGAIVGAAAGILLAPEKGKDTRKKIVGAVEDFADKYSLKLTRKQMEELAEDIEEITPDND